MKRVKILVLSAIFVSITNITSVAGQWQVEGPTWKYIKDDGKSATSEWVVDNDEWYFFGNDSIMRTGWILDNEHWYFLGSDGAMYTNIYTPKGYYVGSDGTWIPNYDPYIDNDDNDSGQGSASNGSASNSGNSQELEDGKTDGPH